MRTKLAALTASGLVATLLVGALGLADARTTLRDRPLRPVTRAADARHLLERLADEALSSTWLLTTGSDAARNRLSDDRLATDRAARALFADPGPPSDALARLRVEWLALRGARAGIDRRTTADSDVIDRFGTLLAHAVTTLQDQAVRTRGKAAVALTEMAVFGRIDAVLARERSAVTAALARGALREPTAEAIGDARAARRTPEYTDIDGALARAAPLEALERIILYGGIQAVSVEPWIEASRAAMQPAERAGADAAARARRAAHAEHTDARADFVNQLALVGGIVGALLLSSLLLARSVRRPIKTLAASAHERVERSREAAAAAKPVDPSPPAVTTPDELGAAARAEHDLELVIVERLRADVEGDQHAAARSVDLARRNRPLLDRQRALLRALSAHEPEPARLDTLRRLDALAAQMHRNTESVLVVAGLDEATSATDPASIATVVRNAVGDVGRFVSLDVVGLPTDVEIEADSVPGVEHLLAELLDNAMTASGDGARIIVVGTLTADALELAVSDEGTGMTTEQLDAANELLAHAPLPGFDASLSLGLVVVARLAERLGARVVLRSAEGVGTTATVRLPVSVLRPAERVGAERPIEAQPAVATEPTDHAARMVTVVERAPPRPCAVDESDLESPPRASTRPVRFSRVPAPRSADLLPPGVLH